MSPTSLRVAIVEPDGEMFQFLQRMICDLGHEVIAITEIGPSLIDYCANLRPDVVLTGTLTAESIDVDTTVINGTWQIPVILYADNCDRDLVLNAEHKQVFMYLVKPIRREHLKVALDDCRLQRIRRPQDDDTEDKVVLVAGSREYSDNARNRVPDRPSNSSAMFRATH